MYHAQKIFNNKLTSLKLKFNITSYCIGLLFLILSNCSVINFGVGRIIDNGTAYTYIDKIKFGNKYKIQTSKSKFIIATIDSVNTKNTTLYITSDKNKRDSLNYETIEKIEKIKFPYGKVIGTTIGIGTDLYVLFVAYIFFTFFTSRTNGV